MLFVRNPWAKSQEEIFWTWPWNQNQFWRRPSSSFGIPGTPGFISSKQIYCSSTAVHEMKLPSHRVIYTLQQINSVSHYSIDSVNVGGAEGHFFGCLCPVGQCSGPMVVPPIRRHTMNLTCDFSVCRVGGSWECTMDRGWTCCMPTNHHKLELLLPIMLLECTLHIAQEQPPKTKP